MKRKAYRTAAMRIRTAAVFMWVLSGVFAILVVTSMAVWKNPWVVHRTDAGKTSVEKLTDIAKSHSPYVELSNIDLTFTGFYEVGENNSICSYCYMAAIGDEYILVDVPVSDGGALAADSTADGSTVKDTVIKGQVAVSSAMEKWLAEDEDMSVKDYSNKYHVSPLEIHVYHSDMERTRIYQLMVLVLMIGFAAVGAILWSEAGTAEDEGNI